MPGTGLSRWMGAGTLSRRNRSSGASADASSSNTSNVCQLSGCWSVTPRVAPVAGEAGVPPNGSVYDELAASCGSGCSRLEQRRERLARGRSVGNESRSRSITLTGIVVTAATTTSRRRAAWRATQLSRKGDCSAARRDPGRMCPVAGSMSSPGVSMIRNSYRHAHDVAACGTIKSASRDVQSARGGSDPFAPVERS